MLSSTLRVRARRAVATLAVLAWLPYVLTVCSAIPGRHSCPMFPRATSASHHGWGPPAGTVEVRARHTCCERSGRCNTVVAAPAAWGVFSAVAAMSSPIVPERPATGSAISAVARVLPTHDPPPYLLNAAFLI
jgi:hypothetical protein